MASMTQFVSSSKKTKSKNSTLVFDIVETEIKDTSNNYNTIREPYKSSQYVPNTLISIIIQHHFPSAEVLHAFSENHLICKIRVKDLLVNSVKNWEYNRPPDMSRCPDIARFIYNSRKPIDTMVFLTYTNMKDIFEVMDGIHRLTALTLLKEENSKPMDFLCPGEFGANNDAEWLFEQYLIVNIRFNANKGDLFEVFENLNKSQTVPELYMRDCATEKRNIVDEIANEWQWRYKKHFVSSSKPIIGHTNRNKFTDLLYNLYDKYKINETCLDESRSKDKLRNKLEIINSKVSYKIPISASINARVKCKETGCYLFLYKNDKLLEDFI